MKINGYNLVIFDCDGVILNSNRIKTNAFYETALSFGANEEQAMALSEYHTMFGGVSRYKKFEFFLTNIMGINASVNLIDKLSSNFSKKIKDDLLKCEISPFLLSLRRKNTDANWMIVSGGNQEELRQLFESLGIAILFNAGIFGSPDSKEVIMLRELKNQSPESILYIGDSIYDHKVSIMMGIDFVFLSEWTEAKNWEEYCQKNSVEYLENLGCLI